MPTILATTAALLTLWVFPQPAHAGRRAVVVGANDGGGLLEPLRYAEDDAKRVADVLGDLGGFDQIDLLLSPTPDAVRGALALAGPRDDVVVFYYSGHADSVGLRLGEGSYAYAALKGDLAATRAEVRLGVLDACRSGAITHLKGASVQAPFLGFQGMGASGDAWITASAADEDAQESQRLSGSFFTHYLVSGLRGAADMTGDGWVTLAEAYTFARERTVAHTSATTTATQHPTFAFDLHGSDDLRLTHVQQASARLRFPDSTSGRISVHRLRDGHPVAELLAEAGRAGELALAPDHYLLRRREGGELYEAIARLEPGAVLTVHRWGRVPGEAATSKGLQATDPIDPSANALANAALSEAQRERDFLTRDVQVLEADVAHLNQRIAAQSAAVEVLGEVRSQQLATAHAALVHLESMPAAYRLLRVTYRVDGEVVWVREATEGGRLYAFAAHTLRLQPGPHHLKVDVVLRGRPSGPFRYLDDYTIERHTSSTFMATEGEIATVTVVTDTRSGLMIPFVERPQLRIDSPTAQLTETAPWPTIAASR